MKIGYKLYFMSEKLRKMQLIYPIFFLFFFISPYSRLCHSDISLLFMQNITLMWHSLGK